MLSPTLPLVLFGLGLLPYAVALFINFVELGDPPNPSNDWLQRLLLFAWGGLFVLSVLFAAGTRDLLVFGGVAAMVVSLGCLGLFFAL